MYHVNISGLARRSLIRHYSPLCNRQHIDLASVLMVVERHWVDRESKFRFESGRRVFVRHSLTWIIITEVCRKKDIQMSDTPERPPVQLSGRLIELFTAYPCVGTGDAEFSLSLPAELSDRIYETVIKQVEFRRKCMNQGFDNLLELLAIHKDGFDATAKVVDTISPNSTKSPKSRTDD